MNDMSDRCAEDGPPAGIAGVLIEPGGPPPGRSSSLSFDGSGHSLPSAGTPLRSSMKGSRDSLRSDIDGSGHSDGSSALRVSFSSLEIREYPMTLGDCPTAFGPPVQLGWSHDPAATESYDVDYYEGHRGASARRTKREMLIPQSHRTCLLMREAGFTMGEINIATEEARRAARRRQRTAKMATMGLGPFEEALEKTKRKLGRVSVGKMLTIRP